jgi:hypothetical protein
MIASRSSVAWLSMYAGADKRVSTHTAATFENRVTKLADYFARRAIVTISKFLKIREEAQHLDCFSAVKVTH